MTIFYMHTGNISKMKDKKLEGNTSNNSNVMDSNNNNNSSKTSHIIKWRKRGMASCFDFRMRTTSMDFPNVNGRSKMARLGRLFRSKSESDAIQPSKPSSKPSPKASPGAPPRRRFVRVVRNDENAGEEFENPHVVRKYSKDYWESKQLEKSMSLEGVDKPLPYTVSGNTILKKHGSVDSDSPTSCSRRALFCEDVQVIEFDKKEKIKKRICYMHEEKLQDSSDDDMSSNSDFELKRHKIKGKRVPRLEGSDEEADPVALKQAGICVSSIPKEELTLNIINYESSSMCSPVKEETDEELASDSCSEASSEVSEGQLQRDWTEENMSTQPSIASKIMSIHAENIKKEDKIKNGENILANET